MTHFYPRRVKDKHEEGPHFDMVLAHRYHSQSRSRPNGLAQQFNASRGSRHIKPPRELMPLASHTASIGRTQRCISCSYLHHNARSRQQRPPAIAPQPSRASPSPAHTAPPYAHSRASRAAAIAPAATVSSGTRAARPASGTVPASMDSVTTAPA